jgi:WD40 repeat protein
MVIEKIKLPYGDILAWHSLPTSGVTYMAMSPEGEAIVTGGAGEILCFWNVFTGPQSQKVSAQFITGKNLFNRSHIL